MYCTQCGNEVEQHARFCSKCGHETAATPQVTAPPPQKRADRDMEMHVNILGWLLIGSGILTALGGFIVLFAGQVIRRLPMVPPDMPAGMPHFVGWLAGVIGLAAIAVAAGTAAAGVGLLQYQSWARVVATIMAVLLVFHFPIGTVIAVYAFWVLYSREGVEYYRTRSAGTMTASGT